jgi:hypothetical protein
MNDTTIKSKHRSNQIGSSGEVGHYHTQSRFDFFKATTSALGCAAGAALVGSTFAGPVGGIVGVIAGGLSGMIFGGRHGS